MGIYSKLLEIQNKLKVSKEQFNSFGNYRFRSCEDILEGVKPLLKEYNTILTLSDGIVLIGDRYYIESIATITDVDENSSISTKAYAREDLAKKGMDLAQITGSASSYARKYALSGLFGIDDTKDADSLNKTDVVKHSSNDITIEQAKELTKLCIKQWGEKNAKEYFQRLTDYESTLDVPVSQFEKIKKAIVTEVAEL